MLRLLIVVTVVGAALVWFSDGSRPPPSQPAADLRPALRVIDDRLVDETGRPVRLRGVSRSGPEYACVSDHDLGLFDGPTDDRTIDAMTAWRINSVRIPLNAHCWLGVNGAPIRRGAAAYRTAVERYVRRLRDAGLYVVLDLHWSGHGTEKATDQARMADRDHAPLFWSSVARAFKGEPGIVFDLYNEPYGIGWQCWRDGCTVPDEGWHTVGMQRLIDVVRATGASQPIVATGIRWGTDLSGWQEFRPHDPAGQLAAGLHLYDFNGCTEPSCWEETVAPVAGSVPVIALELGQERCGGPFLEAFLRWADEAGLSYFAWGWNPHGCEAPSLIESWDGRPTPTGLQVRRHLRRVG